MRKDASQPLLMARQRVWCGLALGAAFVCGCATGVDVTDDELAEICSDPVNRCSVGSAGASGGNVGGSTGGGFGGSSNGGTFSSNGGSGAAPSTGGSVGTNGGTGGSQGSSGSGGTGTTLPLAEGECLPTDDIVVLYRDRTSAAASHNEPSMEMQVQNPGGTSFPLSDLAIRYWFTADGTSNFIATVNNQDNIKDSIEVSFGQEFGSDYAEMTFPTLTDMIGPQGINQLQLRFHADPYAALNQTNDFSFLSGATGMTTPNRNITPYLQNEQVGGCVPIPP
jgi:hypothetical protein